MSSRVRRPDLGIVLVLGLLAAIVVLAALVLSLWEDRGPTSESELSRPQHFEIRRLDSRVAELASELREMRDAARLELEPAMRSRRLEDLRAKEAELAEAKRQVLEARDR